MARKARRKPVAEAVAAAEMAPQAVAPSLPEPQPYAVTIVPDASSLEERVAKLETRPADAWLERRLRVFEHTLTDLQKRQEQVEHNSASAAGLLEQTLSELKQLIGDVDQRQREAMKSLRSAVVGVSSRMEGVEAAIRAVGANPTEPLAFEPEPVQEPEPEPAKPIESEHGARAEPQPGNASFLAAARSAAKAAAESPKSARRPSVRLPRLLRRLKRTQLLMIGGAALLVLFATVGAVLSKTVSQADASEPVLHQTSQRTGATAREEYKTGLKYLTGHGVPANSRLAALWFGRAARQGDALAQCELAAMFRRGVGVKSDAVKAFRWYALAAQQGNRKAMHNLATAYAEGWGTPKDFAQAAGWYARAAGLGYVDSAFNLAVLYERGAGVPQSLTDAYKWYAVAAAEGDSQSASRVDVLASQLAPDDLAKAQAWARDFKPAPYDPEANLAPRKMAAN